MRTDARGAVNWGRFAGVAFVAVVLLATQAFLVASVVWPTEVAQFTLELETLGVSAPTPTVASDDLRVTVTRLGGAGVLIAEVVLVARRVDGAGLR